METPVSTDLYCCESLRSDDFDYNVSLPDPRVLDDPRVLESLLQVEESYQPSSSYFQCVQTESTPEMREIVSHWLLDVCTKERREEEVFALAMNLLDRYMSLMPVGRQQLQVLGTVCLLLSSKLKETPAIDANKLVYYADGAFRLEDLKRWEMVVMARLKWDISAITPHAFLDQILHRLQFNIAQTTVQRIRQQAIFFIKICATDSRFLSHTPSMVAASAIASAIQEMLPLNCSDCQELSEIFLDPISKAPADFLHFLHTEFYTQYAKIPPAKIFMMFLYDRLHKITQIDADCLKECHRQLENWAKKNGRYQTSCPVTPTDVQDVVF